MLMSKLTGNEPMAGGCQGGSLLGWVSSGILPPQGLLDGKGLQHGAHGCPCLVICEQSKLQTCCQQNKCLAAYMPPRYP